MAQSQLDDYFRQVFEESILDLPVHKQSLTTNAMRFLDKRQEIDAVDASLQSKRNEFKVACEQIRQRRDKLSNNEGKAKEALFKFDKFITENDAKRSRGKKKADLQKVMVAQKEQELDDLKREYRTLLSRREKLSCRVTKSTVYHAFLTKLTHMSKKFEDIAQVIARFDTLLATRDQLLEQGTRANSQAERQHVEMRRYVSQQSSLLLQLNNALSKLQTELDAVFSRGGKLEYAWNSIQSTAATETLMLGQVKFGILNLFHTARAATGDEDAVPLEDSIKQLEKIQLFIQDLVDITSSSV